MNEYDDDTDGPPGASDDLLRCRCFGIDRRTHCERDATAEDGYCDGCRCPHGGCSSHGDDEEWTPTLFFDDPVSYMAWFGEASKEAYRCKFENRTRVEVRSVEDD